MAGTHEESNTRKEHMMDLLSSIVGVYMQEEPKRIKGRLVMTDSTGVHTDLSMKTMSEAAEVMEKLFKKNNLGAQTYPYITTWRGHVMNVKSKELQLNEVYREVLLEKARPLVEQGKVEEAKTFLKKYALPCDVDSLFKQAQEKPVVQTVEPVSAKDYVPTLQGHLTRLVRVCARDYDDKYERSAQYLKFTPREDGTLGMMVKVTNLVPGSTAKSTEAAQNVLQYLRQAKVLKAEVNYLNDGVLQADIPMDQQMATSCSVAVANAGREAAMAVFDDELMMRILKCANPNTAEAVATYIKDNELGSARN